MINVKAHKDSLREIVTKEMKSRNVKPGYYVVSGSHLYGYASEDSDIDIRGFHVAPGEQYMKLQTPKEQFELNGAGQFKFLDFDDSLEYDGGELDLVSYELRKFGKLLRKMNFNVAEWVTTIENQIFSATNPEIYELIDLVNKYKGGLVKHYYGMAKSNHQRWLCEDGKGQYTPTRKKYLYVFRGLLGTLCVLKKDIIQPNIRHLSFYNLSRRNKPFERRVGNAVRKLIDGFDAEDSIVPSNLRVECDDIIDLLFEEIDELDFPEIDREELTTDIDNWMMKYREEVNVYGI